MAIGAGDGEVGDLGAASDVAEFFGRETAAGGSGAAHADHGGFGGRSHGGSLHHGWNRFWRARIFLGLGRDRGEVDLGAGAGEGVFEAIIFAGAAAAHGFDDFTVASDDKHRGETGDEILGVEYRVFPAVFAQWVEGHGEFVFFGVALDPAVVGRAGIVSGDAEEHDALGGVFLGDAVVVGHRGLAGAAPRGGDINDDDFAAIIAELDRLSFGAGDREFRGDVAGFELV